MAHWHIFKCSIYTVVGKLVSKLTSIANLQKYAFANVKMHKYAFPIANMHKCMNVKKEKRTRRLGGKSWVTRTHVSNSADTTLLFCQQIVLVIITMICIKTSASCGAWRTRTSWDVGTLRHIMILALRVVLVLHYIIEWKKKKVALPIG